MIVCNSTVLIYLAKIGKLNLLKKLFRKVLIPVEVFNEVVIKGKENQHPDAFVIEEAVEEGWIEVKHIEAIAELEELVKAGFRMSDAVYLAAVRMRKEIK